MPEGLRVALKISCARWHSDRLTSARLHVGTVFSCHRADVPTCNCHCAPVPPKHRVSASRSIGNLAHPPHQALPHPLSSELSRARNLRGGRGGARVCAALERAASA